MVGSTLAAVASRHDSITPTLYQSQSHASESKYGSKVDQRRPKDVENADSEEKARLDQLGRERPAKFKSIWAEVAFCYSIIASMIMAV